MEIQRTQPQNNLAKLTEKDLGDNALNLFISKKPVLTHYSNSFTIGDTIHHPSMRSLVKTNGEPLIGAFVMGLLNEFLSFVPNALKAEEIAAYAENILSECPHWSTSDLILCLKNGRSGKYGPIKFQWKWNPDFIEWRHRYDQEKLNYHYDQHEKKSKDGIKKDAELISLMPKHILEKFNKEKVSIDSKKDISNIHVPKEIVEQGLEAVDAWIEKIRNNKK